MTAIVTDARYRMSLAVIRSLGRAGVGVTAADEGDPGDPAVLGFHSRYAARRARVTSPARDPEAFVADLLRLAPGHDAVIPVTLASVLAVADHAAELGRRLGLAVAAAESIRTANDTDRLLRVASAVGVPVPTTTTLRPGEAVEDLARRLAFPVVVKYRAGEELYLPPGRRYAIVRDPADFPAVFRDMHERQAYPLVQEYIPGAGFGVSVVFNRRREPVAVFQHRRIREYPTTGGPSCFCESTLQPRLTDYAVRLLRELEWVGVAMVEFKQDAAGEYRLMEINPRFWGSLPLAVAAGVDIPLILYRVALGEEVSPVTAYRLGVRMRYLFQDLLSFPGYLKRRRDRFRFVREYLRDLLDPRVVDGVFARDDPKPGLAYTLRTLGRLRPARRRASAGED